jgi:hypothetical protein
MTTAEIIATLRCDNDRLARALNDVALAEVERLRALAEGDE